MNDYITQLKGSEISQLRILVEWRIEYLRGMGHSEDSIAIIRLRELKDKLK